MTISALRLPAAIAACIAVVLAGAPGASAAPAAPTTGASSSAPTTPEPTQPGAVLADDELDLADDELDPAGADGAVRVDVLANDGLPDPAAVRLLLVDPEAAGTGADLGDELATGLGLLRVLSPDTDPADLPEGWDVPEHPVLALEPAADIAPGSGPVAVEYAVVDPAGAEVRARLTVIAEPVDGATPDSSAEAGASAGPSTGAGTTAEDVPSADDASAPDDVPSSAGATDSAAAAAAADPGAHVPADVRAALEAAAARAASRSGEPTASMRPWKGGWEWPHENGVVLWSGAHGAHFVQLRGAIGQKWLAAGAVDTLGWPVADESCGLVGGGCWQAFSKGHTVYWSSATGARAVKTNGAIGHKWIRGGREAGVYGYPVTDERCGLVGGGCWQAFSKAHTVYWSPATGARAVKTNGAIGQRWIAAGRERGTFGYPVSDEAGTGTVHQKFQRGLVTWTRSGGARTHLFQGECHHLNTGRSVQPTHHAGRVSLTIAEGYGRSAATFVQCVRIAGSYVEEWRTSAYVGASGFKRPGVPSGHTQYLYSPQGSYSVTESFGVYNPGTALSYRQLNPNSRWGGRPGTLYNKYFESTGYTWPDENMWYFSLSGDYRLGVVINYNRPPDSPIVQGNGFAIFLHANKKPTAGCIALHEHEVARYMRSARPGDRIIMGVRADLFR